MNYIPYNKNLTKLAQQNRKNPTKPEAKMWNELLRTGSFCYRFLRQKPIGNFILDFYCSRLMLGIEIDGDTHAEQKEYDLKRSQIIKNFGIKIVRYNNSDIMKNLQGIYEDLMQEIKKREIEVTSNA